VKWRQKDKNTNVISGGMEKGEIRGKTRRGFCALDRGESCGKMKMDVGGGKTRVKGGTEKKWIPDVGVKGGGVGWSGWVDEAKNRG